MSWKVFRILNECGFEFLPTTTTDELHFQECLTLGLRLCVFELATEQLQALSVLTLSGKTPDYFPHRQWIEAVSRSFSERVVSAVNNLQEWAETGKILQELVHDGITAVNRLTWWSHLEKWLCRVGPPADMMDFPIKLTSCPIVKSQHNLPDRLRVEATGLGGRDLQFPEPWDISLRSDKYGMSVVPLLPQRKLLCLFLMAMVELSLGTTLPLDSPRQYMNSLCFTTLQPTVLKSGTPSSEICFLIFSSRALQSAELVLSNYWGIAMWLRLIVCLRMLDGRMRSLWSLICCWVLEWVDTFAALITQSFNNMCQ